MENLLLLHGALGSQDQLTALGNLLSSQFNIHLLNFEGHGGRLSNHSFSIDLFSENVLEYMNQNNLSVTHFFGYSMGGYVALDFALKHPDKVGKIITLATKFAWTPESAAKEVKMLNPEIIEQKVPKFANMLGTRHGNENWKNVLHKTATMMQELGNGAALSNSDFAKINHEVAIAVGDKDNMVGLEESREVATSLPQGDLHILEGVEHPIEKVNPLILSELIQKYMMH